MIVSLLGIRYNTILRSPIGIHSGHNLHVGKVQGPIGIFLYLNFMLFITFAKDKCPMRCVGSTFI